MSRGVLGESLVEHLDPPEDEEEEDDGYTNADAAVDWAIDDFVRRVFEQEAIDDEFIG